MSDAESDEKILHNAEIITKVCALLMGGKSIKWESADQIAEFIAAVAAFAKGYPTAPVGGDSGGEKAQTYSFDYDINAISIAFLKYYGIDISWKGQELHWWVFLEYFRNLCGDDLMILRLMEIRGYTGKDKELRKLATKFALPKEMTADDKDVMQSIADEFYGAR